MQHDPLVSQPKFPPLREEITSVATPCSENQSLPENRPLSENIEGIDANYVDEESNDQSKLARRVLNEKTLCNIQRTLKPSGTLHFWTDVLDYYEGTLELIDEVTNLKGPFFISEPHAAHDMDYLTHFERRTRRNGLPVYRSRFTK